MDTLSQIKKHKLIAILRGVNPGYVLKITEALYQGGIRLLEVTMNSADPLQAIEAVSERFGDTMTIGAGTVLDARMAKDAVKAGAHFILSPIFSKQTIRAAKDLGAVSIPGAYTPTEIYKAYKAGGDIIKVFPAGVGGASYIKDILAPLSQIPMLPTGGINLQNIGEFEKIGVAGYGLGSSLVKSKEVITQEYLQELTRTAQQFVQAIS